MAIKGLSKLVISGYEATGNTVTYSKPGLSEKMAEYSLELNQSENKPLYLDNEIAETDAGTFQNGTLKITTGDLSQENAILILDIKEKEITYNVSKKATELVYDDEYKSKTVGVGFIELHQVDGIDKYKAFFLNKVTFKIPNDAAVTKGESVEWQTREIEGEVMRSNEVNENYVHPWKTEAWFDTDSEALEYLMYKGGKQSQEVNK